VKIGQSQPYWGGDYSNFMSEPPTPTG
jgi:hypothetical protein